MLEKIERGFLWVVGVVIIVQLSVFVYAIVTDLKVQNEYIYLDQRTILNDGSIVSNHEFDKNELALLDVTSDYRGYPSSLSAFYPINTVVDINRKPDIRYYPYDRFGDISEPYNKYNYMLEGMAHFYVVNVDEHKEIVYSRNDLFNVFYSSCDNSFAVKTSFIDFHNSPISEGSKSFIGPALAPCINGNYRRNLLPLIVADTDERFQNKLDYVQKNINEKWLQAFDRYYFHEASFILAPINEIRLGRPLKAVFSQYGFLSIIGVSAIMDVFGGLSFPNYEKAIKASYLIYYLMFLFICFQVLRTREVALASILIFSIGIYANSYYFFTYPPGHAPIRHFFDFVVLYFIFRYEEHRRLLNLAIAAFFVAISILVNKEYGLFVALAFFGACIYFYIKSWQFGRRLDNKFLGLAFLSLFSSVSIVFSFPLAENPSSKYFLGGFYSFQVTWKHYFVVLFSIVLQLSIVSLSGSALLCRQRFFVFVFAALYSQLLYFYFVWGGGHAHFFTLLIIYSMPYLLVVDAIGFNWGRIRGHLLLTGNSFLLILVLITGYRFGTDGWSHFKSFDDHQTYRWTLPRAEGMITKIDPAPFEDSVEIIRRNNSGNEIFMISKYDNILSILSEKYSGTSFFELRSLMVTKSEYDMVVKEIAGSELVFVDNDIERDFENELQESSVWTLLPSFYYEHRYQRIPKLKILRQLYRDTVKKDFELLERGSMISVYRKKV